MDRSFKRTERGRGSLAIGAKAAFSLALAGRAPPLVDAIAMFLLAYCGGIGFYLVVEKPLLNLRQRATARKKAAALSPGG